MNPQRTGPERSNVQAQVHELEPSTEDALLVVLMGLLGKLSFTDTMFEVNLAAAAALEELTRIFG